MTGTLVVALIGCELILTWIHFRVLRRQKVLADLLVVQSDLADYWANLMTGMTRIRLDFGADEAVAWLDSEVEASEATFRELINRNDELAARL